MNESKLILIVDDNLTNLKLIRVLLESEGYEIVTAKLAEEVFQLLNTISPGLILMDIQLPGMSGLEITKLLKSQEKTKNIPIIAITAYAMKGDEQKAFSAGYDDYVTKPIDTRTFSKLIESHFKKII